MKLTTIWTLPAMTLRERLSQTGEAVVRTVAHHLPRRIAYWSYIDTTSRYIEDHEIVPDVPAMTILQRIR
jgi:hypothetical protein